MQANPAPHRALQRPLKPERQEPKSRRHRGTVRLKVLHQIVKLHVQEQLDPILAQI